MSVLEQFLRRYAEQVSVRIQGVETQTYADTPTHRLRCLSGAPERHYANTPIRRYTDRRGWASVFIRIYADTPIRRGAEVRSIGVSEYRSGLRVTEQLLLC